MIGGGGSSKCIRSTTVLTVLFIVVVGPFDIVASDVLIMGYRSFGYLMPLSRPRNTLYVNSSTTSARW